MTHDSDASTLSQVGHSNTSGDSLGLGAGTPNAASAASAGMAASAGAGAGAGAGGGKLDDDGALLLKPFTFKLAYKTHRYYFRTENELQFLRWVSVLKTALMNEPFAI